MRESGEFIVIVAAVEIARKDDKPTSLEAASSWRDSYTERMFLGAARVLGRANAAPIAALSAGESFDMIWRLQSWDTGLFHYEVAMHFLFIPISSSKIKF